MDTGLILFVGLLILAFFLFSRHPSQLIDEFSNYGPEYSTNNPEGAPWDVSSPFYRSFWGYDSPYYGGWNGWNNYYY